MNRDQEIAALYAEGRAVRAISYTCAVTVQTVYAALRRRGVPLRRERLRADLPILIAAAQRGVPTTRAAKLLGISPRTARREIQARRAQGEAILIKKGRPPAGARAPETDVDIVVARLLLTPLPYPTPLDADAVAREFARLRALTLTLDGDVIRPQSLAGLKICAPFFPNRYAAASKRNPSAVDAWHSRTEIERAVALQLKYGDPVTPPRVLRAVTLRCRTPTIFRPAVARFICERYCPPGGTVWDPCAGYGGRLLGAAAAGVRYVGTDVDAATVDGNRRLAEAVGAIAEIHLRAAETFDPPRVDLVFTSPPYFDREQYSQTEEQSWKKHGANLGTWVCGFLRPVADRARRALSAEGTLVLNIADIRERGEVVPIVARTVSTICESGFRHVETLRMPIASINRKNASEPVLVFRRKKEPCP